MPAHGCYPMPAHGCYSMPPSYHTMAPPSESEPLMQSSSTRSAPESRIVRSLIVVLVLILGLESGYIWSNMATTNIYDPQERIRIRRNWDRECALYHQNITRLSLEQEHMRFNWTIEHDRLSILRDDFAREQKQWQDQRREWEEERQKRQEEERERLRKFIHWGQLRRDQEPCISYGKARYQAPLAYVPPGWDTYTVCKETPIHIHDRDVVPTECQSNGQDMIGIWIVDFDEPSCKPWWRDSRDHGCTSRHSGIHRYEAHLEGYLEPNEYKSNWADMCATTPHTMFGHTYQSPFDCVFWGRIGVYGFWDIPDDSCK